MSASAPTASGIRAQLQVPVLRAGYALVVSTLATSGLGAAYWFVAARRYDTDAVGVGSALVAVTTLLAGIANLGLKNGLLRFIPIAGAKTGQLMRRSYGLSAICALAAGTVFLAGARVWSPDLLFLRQGILPPAVFLATLAAWAIFVLQDSVLVGLGRATWVPIENIVFSIVKIVMLVCLAAVSSRWGIFLSWGIPTLGLIAVVNWAIVRKWLASHVAATIHVEPSTFGDVLRFSLADQVATLFWIATLDGLPLLVLRRSGATDAAYYYLSAQVAYGLYFLSGCIGAAFVAEGSRDPQRLLELNHRVMKQAFSLVVPATAGVVIASPLILRIFGASYEHNATGLLRSLALSALPYTVTSITLSRARVQRRMKTVIGGHGAIFVLCVGLAAALQGRYGLLGVGIGVLLGQTIVAAGIAGSLALTALRHHPSGALIARAGHVRNHVRHWRAKRRLHDELAVLALPAGLRGGHARLLSVHNDVIVAEVGGTRGEAIVKLATRREARSGLRKHAQALRSIHADPLLAAVARHVPSALGEGVTDASLPYVIESKCPGTASSDAFNDPARKPEALRSLAMLISELHISTAQEVVIGEELIDRWVDGPLRTLTKAVRRPSRRFQDGTAVLGAELRAALLGRRVEVARVHGDLTPGNVLLEGTEVTGLVDWERSHAHGLPAADFAMFLLALHRERDGSEFGEIVLAFAANPQGLDSSERFFIECGQTESGLSTRVIMLLAWLWHAESNLGKAKRYRNSILWLHRNVLAVIEGLPDADHRTGEGRVPTSGDDTSATSGRRRAHRTQMLGTSLLRRAERAVNVVGGLATAAILTDALAVWFWSLRRVNVQAMTDTGLISVLPLTAWAAGFAIIAAVVHALTRPSVPERRLLALLTGFVVMIHSTSPVLYQTLRYSWAWKHVGIVDYISRRGSVNPRIGALDVYHNWPGFFSANAALVNLVGSKNAVAIAIWSPVAINLLILGALLLLLPALEADRRVVWTAVWFYFLANWIGQDYFSPQAMAYFMYLVIIALLLRHFSRAKSTFVVRDPRRAVRQTAAAALILLVLTGALISSHQLTPGLLIAVIALLVVMRRVRAGWLLAGAVCIQALWLLGPARPFAAKNLASTLESFGSPLDNAGATLRDTSIQSHGQAFVSMAGRGLVVLLTLAAVIGLVMRIRGGHRDWTAIILLISPVLLVVGNEFGGEILFRAFLFAVPFLALFASWALLGRRFESHQNLRAAGLAAMSCLLFLGFMAAHFGKDRSYHFSKAEIAASTFLAEHAVEPTLLATGNGNYPAQFLNYERFVYVPIQNEPTDSIEAVLADPVERLTSWLSDSRYRKGFVFITRSQKADAEAEGGLPTGALDRIEDVLRASPRFAVAFENEDATVFTLAPRTVIQ